MQNNMQNETGVLNMLQNQIAKTEEYYDIGKRQARASFWIATSVCICGLLFLAAGIVISACRNDVSWIALITGAFVELFSGGIFLIYKKSLAQLHAFQKQLNSTARYLTVIELIGRVQGVELRDRLYEWIVQSCILMDREIQLGRKVEDRFSASESEHIK